MRLALRHWAEGEQATLPSWVMLHLVASRYGTTPEAVRDWPATDYLHAATLESYRDGRRGR